MKKRVEVGDSIGHYVIQGNLGRGTMGSVYLAHPQGTPDYLVALKVLDPRLNFFEECEFPELRARWQREYHAMRKLNHPNIVRILHPGVHVNEIEEVPYIAMEYVPGRPLSEMILQGPMGPQRSIAVGRGIGRGLCELHNAGIVHRDLKPNNVVLAQNDHPVILDFGISVMESENEARLTHPGLILGTPGFMAPELFMPPTENPSQASDVYALGAIVYSMLAGRMPRFSPGTALFTKELEELLDINIEAAVKPLGAEFGFLQGVLEPMLELDACNRPTAREALDQLDWADSRVSYENTRAHDVSCKNPTLWHLLEDAATLPKDKFLRVHRDVRGLLLSKHCYAALDTPVSLHESCECAVHVLRGIRDRRFMIGRHSEDVTIPDARVSRQHAVLSTYLRAPGEPHYRVSIQDLASRNGTWVNGSALEGGSRVLASGDEINCAGSSVLQFLYAADFYTRVCRASAQTAAHKRNSDSA